MADLTVSEVSEVKPPVTVVGPLAWLRKNLFSTWYNVLFTLLILWLLFTLLKPAYEWATTEARWGVIEANLTLFMVGQYPREQIGRVWLCIFLLAGLIGFSWGVWKNTIRGFALIAVGAGISLLGGDELGLTAAYSDRVSRVSGGGATYMVQLTYRFYLGR